MASRASWTVMEVVGTIDRTSIIFLSSAVWGSGEQSLNRMLC